MNTPDIGLFDDEEIKEILREAIIKSVVENCEGLENPLILAHRYTWMYKKYLEDSAYGFCSSNSSS